MLKEHDFLNFVAFWDTLVLNMQMDLSIIDMVSRIFLIIQLILKVSYC